MSIYNKELLRKIYYIKDNFEDNDENKKSLENFIDSYNKMYIFCINEKNKKIEYNRQLEINESHIRKENEFKRQLRIADTKCKNYEEEISILKENLEVLRKDYNKIYYKLKYKKNLQEEDEEDELQ